MKKVIISTALLLSVISFSFAQRERTVIGDNGFDLSGAWGGWSYNGQFGKDFSTFSGGMWALEFGKKFYIGSQHNRSSALPINGSTTNFFSIKSDQLLLGFTPASYRAVHPILSLGIGSSRIDVTGESDRAFTLQPAAGLELNLVRWCHIDAQVGYRYIADSQFTGYKAADFSGLYGQVNLKFGFSWGRYRNGDRNFIRDKKSDNKD